MKILSPLVFLVACGLLLYSTLQMPLMKVPTDEALRTIELSFLKEGLSEEDRKTYRFYRNAIHGNQKGSVSAYEASRSALAVLTVILACQNLVLLVGCMRKKKPNKIRHRTP